MRITELKKNCNGKILNINAKGVLAERLLELGFTNGSYIKFLHEFNSTFAFQIKNTVIALRKEDAEKILIKEGD